MSLADEFTALQNGIPRKKPPAQTGLTGADLEQAKADAELAAADKRNQTARDHNSPAAYHATLAPMGDAAAHVANVARARNPEGAARGDSAVAALRALADRLHLTRTP